MSTTNGKMWQEIKETFAIKRNNVPTVTVPWCACLEESWKSGTQSDSFIS